MASGRSTAASLVLQRHNAELVTVISAGDLLSLTLKLYGEGLIERETKDDVCLLVHTPLQKACIVVSAVERKVETDPSLFHQFTALLQNEGDCLKAIGKRLLDEYRPMPKIMLNLSPHNTPHHCSPFHPCSPLCLYANKLRTIYALSELPIYSNPTCYKWTPSPSRKYIDLLLIDRKGMTLTQVDKCKKAALYGQINKITEKGSVNTVKMEEILQAKSGETLKCVLVEGPPGIGKSTLAWQVCNRWGKRELFQQYTIVLLLPLRDQRVQRATCVEDLFISTDTKLQEGVRKEVSQETWEGKDTLIILEGLDELPSHLLSQPSIFTALLSGTELLEATILITSRPSATDQLLQHWKQRISRHYEISGFTEENIEKYVQSVLSDYSEFKKYVSIHPHIRSMLYVPLHCVITVTVYLQCQQARIPHPKTLTGLYICLTQTILTQYLNDHPQYINGECIHVKVFDLCLPHPVNNYFKELCRIAFEHINDQQLTFSGLPKDLHSLGFTDAIPELLLYQQSTNFSYNFLHLSVQEFLAAYHVSLMSSSEQEQLLTVNQPNLTNVLRFVAGINKFQGLDKVIVRQAIGIILCENTSDQSAAGYLDDYSLEVLYECQDVSILDTEYTYHVTLNAPSLHLCLALGYCIANSSSCGWKLELQRCFHGTQAEMILQGLKEHKACHTSYSIECNHCRTDFTCVLFTQTIPDIFIFAIESLCFEDLSLLNSRQIPPCLPELISRMKRLNTLTLMNVNITSLIELVPALSRVSTLRNLTLYKLNSEGIALLCQWLPTCQLETLRLPELQTNDIEMTSEALTTVSSLRILDIEESNYIFPALQLYSDDVIFSSPFSILIHSSAFASMLQQNQLLTELHINGCSIDSVSGSCLAEALHHNTTLRKLDMSNAKISNNVTVVLAMAEMLQHNTTLEELYINGTEISSDGAVAIAEALCYNTALRKLDMSKNPVGDRGALAMAEMLRYNITLKKLKILLCNVNIIGNMALLGSLAVNQHLKKLIVSVEYNFIESLSDYHNHKERIECYKMMYDIT